MKVAVLKGGRGLERQVSLRSGARVEDALGSLGHEVLAIDVGADLVATLKAERPDAAFIALHGRGGEDGTVQELLEILRVPYTGPGVRACGRSIDKVAAKHDLRAAGVPTPDWAAFNALAFRELGAADALEEIEANLGFPLVVKPAAGGSSLGVRFASSAEEVPEALLAAFSYDDRVLLERHVEGRELAIALVNGIALPAVEIVPREADRFNYEARYEIGRTEYICPAQLGAAEGPILDAALRTWDALGFDGFCRVDMILAPDGSPGAGGERDPRPHRHLAAADGGRGGGARASSGSASGCSSWRSNARRRPRGAGPDARDGRSGAGSATAAVGEHLVAQESVGAQAGEPRSLLRVAGCGKQRAEPRGLLARFELRRQAAGTAQKLEPHPELGRHPREIVELQRLPVARQVVEFAPFDRDAELRFGQPGEPVHPDQRIAAGRRAPVNPPAAARPPSG